MIVSDPLISPFLSVQETVRTVSSGTGKAGSVEIIPFHNFGAYLHSEILVY